MSRYRRVNLTSTVVVGCPGYLRNAVYPGRGCCLGVLSSAQEYRSVDSASHTQGSPRDLAALRRSYQGRPLLESDLAADPIAQFTAWFADAEAAGIVEPNAMIVATSSLGGRPSAR